MNILKARTLKIMNHDNNQDILSRLSESKASSQVFCPRSNNEGIAYPRLINFLKPKF